MSIHEPKNIENIRFMRTVVLPHPPKEVDWDSFIKMLGFSCNVATIQVDGVEMDALVFVSNELKAIESIIKETWIEYWKTQAALG